MFSAIYKQGVPMTDTYVCKSGDVKEEEGKGNGDFLVEIDTGKVYIFDSDGAAGAKWVEFGGE